MDAFHIVVKENDMVCAEIGDQIVGGVTVCNIVFQWAQDTYVGMGGIAGVGTDERYRRRGIAQACMNRANKLILEKGYSCGGVSTGLRNIARRLYMRSGYVNLFKIDFWKRPEKCDGKLRLEDLTIRPFKHGDEYEAVNIFKETYGGYFGPKQKKAEEWLELRLKTLESDPESILFAEFKNRLIGYTGYFLQWDSFLASELIVAPSPIRIAAANILLEKLYSHIASKGLDDVTLWAASEDAEISHFLACNGYQKREDRVFMVNILNLLKLLEELNPLFRSRIDKTNLEWQGTVKLKTPSQIATLTIGDGISVEGKPVSNASIEVVTSKEALTEVITGIIPIWEAYVCGMISVKPVFDQRSLKVLDTLFPAIPHFHPVDDWW